VGLASYEYFEGWFFEQIVWVVLIMGIFGGSRWLLLNPCVCLGLLSLLLAVGSELFPDLV
jgi:hypothetical protein